MSAHEPALFSILGLGRETRRIPSWHLAETWRVRKAGRAPHSRPVAFAAPWFSLAGAAAFAVAPSSGLKHSGVRPAMFSSSPLASQTRDRSLRDWTGEIDLSRDQDQAQPTSIEKPPTPHAVQVWGW